MTEERDKHEHRERLESILYNKIDKNYREFLGTDLSSVPYKTIVRLCMQAIDEFIEEYTPEKEEIKIGDKVRLKRKLSSGDDSMTNKFCDVSSYMERIPAGDVGKVEIYDGRNEAHVKFESASQPWYFHTDDLEKV